MNVENENTSLMNSLTQLEQLIFMWRLPSKMESRMIGPLFDYLLLFLGSCFRFVRDRGEVRDF